MNNDIIIDYLKQKFPTPRCELNYKNMFELLIAVMLSAQCTDKRVNNVTPCLFEKYPTAEDLANADIEDVKNIIKSCGMFNTKAKNIISCSKKLVSDYNGVVPSTIEELSGLDGVGRKTASVVLCEGFKIPAMPVDTHIFRISRRLGISQSNNVTGVENDLKKSFDKSEWADLHLRLVLFGRYYCKAVKPMCEDCLLKDICKYYSEKKD